MPGKAGGEVGEIGVVSRLSFFKLGDGDIGFIVLSFYFGIYLKESISFEK